MRVIVVKTTQDDEVLTIIKKGVTLRSLSKTVDKMQAAISIFEFGPKKEKKDPPQSAP